jgi:transposase
LKRRVYGRKSETAATQPLTNPNHNNDKPPRKRGQQPGGKGHGRRSHEHLLTTDETCDLPDTQKSCCQCGEPLEEIPGTADGDILEIDVRAHRRRYRRKRYRCRCGCANQPGVVTARANSSNLLHVRGSGQGFREKIGIQRCLLAFAGNAHFLWISLQQAQR